MLRVETFKLGLKNTILNTRKKLEKKNEEVSSESEDEEMDPANKIIDMERLSYLLTNKLLDIEIFA